MKLNILINKTSATAYILFLSLIVPIQASGGVIEKDEDATVWKLRTHHRHNADTSDITDALDSLLSIDMNSPITIRSRTVSSPVAIISPRGLETFRDENIQPTISLLKESYSPRKPLSQSPTNSLTTINSLFDHNSPTDAPSSINSPRRRPSRHVPGFQKERVKSYLNTIGEEATTTHDDAQTLMLTRSEQETPPPMFEIRELLDNSFLWGLNLDKASVRQNTLRLANDPSLLTDVSVTIVNLQQMLDYIKYHIPPIQKEINRLEKEYKEKMLAKNEANKKNKKLLEESLIEIKSKRTALQESLARFNNVDLVEKEIGRLKKSILHVFPTLLEEQLEIVPCLTDWRNLRSRQEELKVGLTIMTEANKAKTTLSTRSWPEQR